MKQFVLISLFMLVAGAGFSQQRSVRGIIPHHAKMQFAGSIGFLSAGFGYENKKRTMEGDLYYGYVPKSLGGVTMHSITAKTTFFPFREKQEKGFQFRPLSAGALVSYTFGKQFFLFSPDNYPYKYYGFPTALHVGVFVGGQVSTTFNKKSVRKVALYYELGTNDKELKSFLGNNSIPFRSILNLGIGIKTTF